MKKKEMKIGKLNGYTFKIAEEKELHDTAEVYMRIFRGKPFFENWYVKGMPFAGEVMDASKIIEDYYEKGLILIAKDKDRVIGFAAMEEGVHEEDLPYISFFLNNKALYLSDIGVDPSYWGKGIGSNLFDSYHNFFLDNPFYDVSFLRTNASLEVQKEAEERMLAFGNLSLRDKALCSFPYSLAKSYYGAYVEEKVLPREEMIRYKDRCSMSEGIAKRYGYYLAKDAKGIPILNSCPRERSNSKKIELDVRNYYVYEKKRGRR